MSFLQKTKHAAATKTASEPPKKKARIETPLKKHALEKATPMKEAKKAAKKAQQGEEADVKKDEVEGEDEDAASNRKKACAVAREILDNAAKNKKVKVSDEDVLKVLRSWKFGQNTTRKNVIPEGQTWVHSDTLGVVSTLTGDVTTTRSVRDHPEFMQLLGRWLKDNQSKHLPDMKLLFPFTSINVNFSYGARLHRDKSNKGPSLIIAFGEFEGGKLQYYPDDDRKLHLDKLPREHAVTLDLHGKLALFDGNRGHEVEPFTGERYSIVFFTSGAVHRAKPEIQQFLTMSGANWPTEETSKYLASFMPPPRGYHVQGGVCFAKGSGPMDGLMGRVATPARPVAAVDSLKRKASEIVPSPSPKKAPDAKKTSDTQPLVLKRVSEAGPADDADEDGPEAELLTPDVSSVAWRLYHAAGSDLASASFEPGANLSGWSLLAKCLNVMDAQPVCAGVALTNMFRQLVYNLDGHEGEDTVQAEVLSAMTLLSQQDVVKVPILVAAVEEAFNVKVSTGDDIAEAALAGRNKQQTLRLSSSAGPPLASVVDARAQVRAEGTERRSGLTKLLASSEVQDRQAYWMVRLMQGHKTATCGRLSVLRAFAQACALASMSRGGDVELQDRVVHMGALADLALAAAGRAGGAAPFVKVLLEGVSTKCGPGALLDVVSQSCKIQVGVPFPMMDAQIAYSKKKVLNRALIHTQRSALIAESAYTGERVQLHVTGGEACLKVTAFGSDLSNRTDILGEPLTESLNNVLTGKGSDFIIEGVLQGVQKEQKDEQKDDATPNLDIMDRLAGVTTGDTLDPEIAALEEHIKLLKRMRRMGTNVSGPRFVAYDLLFHDGKALTGYPLRDRRARLIDLLKPDPPTLTLAKSHECEAGSPWPVLALGTFNQEAIRTGHCNGLVLKGLDSTYEAGRCPGAWQRLVDYEAAKAAKQKKE